MNNYIECPDCEGQGEIYISCCGDNLLKEGSAFYDYEICPTCREDIPPPTKCETCNGTGEIKNIEKYKTNT